MIKSLFIKNFILIDELFLEFEQGFNVLIGETGAGKSIIIKAIDYMKSKGTAFVVVSHYPQLISNIAPDFVHIMKDGVIVKSGDSNLADTILKEGFENV